jgi:endonuclease/exonuclease/phosphatase (EEP) superfamily protein YafD
VGFFHTQKTTFKYLILVLLGVIYLYFITQPFIPKTLDKKKTNTLKHIQFNLRFDNEQIDKVLNYLKESKADVITLQEVTQEHQKKLEELKRELYLVEFSNQYPYPERRAGAYPYQAYCEFYPVVGAVAILSKYPFNNKQSACLQYQGLQWSQIIVKKQPINIISIHTQWPYPYKQPKQIQNIKPIFKNIKPPTLIAGDFNAASWSHSVKQIENASNTKVVEGHRWTIELKKQVPLIPNFKLAIDHVLLSEEFQVEEIFVERSLGSDHLPVVSRIKY